MSQKDDFPAGLERLDRFLSGEDPGERPIEVMRAAGMDIPPDDALDDQQLHAKLWEIIERMAALGFYIEETDHLSDRELYRFLVNEALVVEELIPGPGEYCHISPIGGGSEEDNEIYLRYYADEETREEWRREFGDPIPPREPLPFERDRLLPDPGERLIGSADA